VLGPLSSRLADVAERTRGSLLEPAAEAALGEILEGLREPLRVAIAGPVNSGKSTLVNALLRQRVAPTDVSECTRVVAWYRYGVPERVEAVAPDGSRSRHALAEGGRLPARVRQDGDPEIARLDVFLSNDALRDVVIIDTPGLASVHEEHSRATRDLLALDATSRVAVSQADAVVFLLGDAGISETTALETFRALASGLQTSPLNAVGVISRADTLGDTGDAGLRIAAAAAGAVADRLRGAVAAVVPLLGLLAETVDTGALTDADLAALRSLAALPPSTTEAMLLTPDRFVNARVEGVSADARGQLLEILDIYGVERALALIRSGNNSAAALSDALRLESGINPLRNLARATFTAHADVLKAGWALAALERVAFSLDPGTHGDARAELLDDLEAIALEPPMHRLAELRILQEVAADRIPLPSALVEDLRRVTSTAEAALAVGLDATASPDEVRGAAAEGVQRWKSFGNDTRRSPNQRWAAEVVAKTYEHLWASVGAR
jgi:hypothetical protein